MAGLLGDFEDPRQQGLLALGLGLLNSRGSFGQGLGQAGMQAMGVMRQATQDQQRKEQMAQQKAMQDFQFQQAQMQAAQQQAQAAKQAEGERARGGYLNSIDPNAGPAMAFNPVSAMRAGLNASEIEQLGPKAGAKPLIVGDTVVDPMTFKPLYQAPAKPEARPELAKLISLRDSFPPGDPNRAIVQQAITKSTTHQPGTSVNVNTAKPLLNTIAEGLGKNIDASLSNAQAAIPAIQTAQTLKQAADSGKLIAGPGSTFRVLGLQVGQMLGVGGKDGAEVLANTRTAIQSMAKAELDAAAQMKGQGQITEAERGIIKRAAAGDIDSLTAPEIRLLAEGMEKTARYKIKQHQANVTRLGQMPGAAPIIPFYSVEDPAPYSGSSGVRKFNPATGKFD